MPSDNFEYLQESYQSQCLVIVLTKGNHRVGRLGQPVAGALSRQKSALAVFRDDNR
jgi:hypothetical protein